VEVLGEGVSEPTADAAKPAHRRLPLFQGILPLDRSNLSANIIAGVTLAALGIPEVMGYAKIAEMPVITGLYTILIPIAVFAVVGPDAYFDSVVETTEAFTASTSERSSDG
jgi:MFS superfamily sulfate permease-like transporter